mmetsp:Transcript_13844/g.15277  ORF Transcript_13844/g.15277 Transcript_13844/m.15277 type:complete len:288 (+) Transcript_13844:27-890(+)
MQDAEFDANLTAALNLLRRMPPQHIKRHLEGVLDLCPDLCEELLEQVEIPLLIAFDSSAQRDYILCDYNRDGDSYRSPWSNSYFPPLSDGFKPCDKMRKLEQELNEAFDIYRELYYEGGVSSAYCWLTEGNDYAFCVTFVKQQNVTKRERPMRGRWQSMHVVEAIHEGDNVTMKLTTTVMVELATKTEISGDISLAGGLTRQSAKTCPVSKVDIGVYGRLIEDMEEKLRQQLQTIYFGKTIAIIGDMRNLYAGMENLPGRGMMLSTGDQDDDDSDSESYETDDDDSY